MLLTVERGVPFARRVRVVDGTSIWASLDEVEVRAQVRSGRSEQAELIIDLTPHLTVSLDSADILIDLVLTGAETRAVAGSGYFDMIMSDKGVTDARALKLLAGQFTVNATVTAAS